MTFSKFREVMFDLGFWVNGRRDAWIGPYSIRLGHVGPEDLPQIMRMIENGKTCALVSALMAVRS